MELALSSLQPCGKFFVGSGLRCAIVFEAIGGHQNSWRRKMRFNQFLVSRIPQLCYRSKHKLAEKLLEEANNYGSTRISDRSKLLDKISVMLGSSNLDDLGDNGSTQQQLVDLENQIDVFNVSLACKKYPCITLGSSPLVELYNDSAWHSQLKTYSETLSCEEFQPISTDGKLVVPESLTEMCTSVYPSLPTIQFSDTTDKDSLPSPVQPQSIGVEAEQLGSSVSEESSFRLLPKCDKLNELMLDKPISCIKGLTKRRSHQLEDCGFHTVRKLLHHFPRTYADLQNSDLGIEDGQYLIFIGRILSSRAVKASYSLSFLEVILRGEVNNLTKSEAKSDDIYSEGKKIIYIHLKKYFRGTRFTSHGFLRMLKNKHEEGDIVCVSGKVKSTSKADHYEMTEYSFDVIENEENSAPIKGRPYPIYPAKGGLKPQFLREIITRSLYSFNLWYLVLVPADYVHFD